MFSAQVVAIDLSQVTTAKIGRLLALSALTICLRFGRTGIPNMEIHESVRFGTDFVIDAWRRDFGIESEIFPAARPFQQV